MSIEGSQRLGFLSAHESARITTIACALVTANPMKALASPRQPPKTPESTRLTGITTPPAIAMAVAVELLKLAKAFATSSGKTSSRASGRSLFRHPSRLLGLVPVLFSTVFALRPVPPDYPRESGKRKATYRQCQCNPEDLVGRRT